MATWQFWREITSKDLLSSCDKSREQTHLILADRGKLISEFKASLEESKFQVNKRLGSDVLVHTWKLNTQETVAFL